MYFMQEMLQRANFFLYKYLQGRWAGVECVLADTVV